jgi:hypothetical protein
MKRARSALWMLRGCVKETNNSEDRDSDDSGHVFAGWLQVLVVCARGQKLNTCICNSEIGGSRAAEEWNGRS